MNQQTVVTKDEETGDIIVGEEPIKVENVLRGHSENLATEMDTSDLDTIGVYVTEKAQNDKDSRADWEDQNERAMKLKGVGPESEPNDLDYENANTSDHPLLLAATTKFLSTAVSEMLPPEQVCIGNSAFDLSELPADQRQQVEADIAKSINRVQKYYLDYLLNRLPSYEEDTDLILRDCGDSGVGWRKVYVDPTMPTPVMADYVASEDLFIAYTAKNPRDCRITHRMYVTAHDLIRWMQAGIYNVCDVGSGSLPEEDAVTNMRDVIQGISDHMMSGGEGHTLYETHCHLFLTEDPHPKGLSRPYVVTVHKETNQVLSIRRNWVEGDPHEEAIQHFVPYIYHPGKSSLFAMGLGALLSNQTEALRDAQRAGLDAGYLANHPAGFKKSTMSIREDSTAVRPGEFVDVDSPGAGPITDMLMLHPFKGPDPGLMSLMDRMEKNGNDLGGVATADLSAMMGASVAPGPAMAAYDEQTKFQSAVHKRLYRAHRTELRLIHQRTREIYANKPVQFGVNSVLQAEDLILVNILPAMDPGQISRGRRMIEAQINLDAAEKFPDVLDKRAAVIDFLNATGSVADNDHLLLPEPEEAKPADAITEYMNALKGRPIVVGPSQNHQAHIDAHLANMQGVQGSDLSTEEGGRVMASLGAHIAEHMAMEMAVQVAASMGMPFSSLMQGIPPEVENQIAPQIALAVQEVERMRRGDEEDPEATKIRIEEIRAENKLAVENLKGNFALQRETMQGAQRKADNETSIQTNTDDNATALLIAGIRGSGKKDAASTGQKPSLNPKAKAGNPNPNPKPRARPDQ